MKTPPPSLIPINTPSKNTFQIEKTVLVIIRSEATLSRLDALCHAIFNDKRIQCVFTVPEPISQFDRGMIESIESRGGLVFSWEDSLRLTFDLAIAASPNGPIETVRAPLMVMQHGPGLVKEAARLDTLKMIHRLQERPYRTIILEPTNPVEIGEDFGDVEVEVVGDPVYDSLVNSAWKREYYRRSMKAGNRKLIVLSSTWGPDSLLAHHPDLPITLLKELPSNNYLIALILHPYAWAAHGKWQIETWLRREIEAGMRLIPHEKGWESVLLAGDCAIGDHGSVTSYAKAIGLPTLIRQQELSVENRKAPLVSVTMKTADAFRSDLQAVLFCKECTQKKTALCDPVSSAFENVLRSHEAIRECAYRLMGLDKPDTTISPLDIPTPELEISESKIYRTRTHRLSSEKNDILIESYPANLPCDKIAYDGFVVAVAEECTETVPPFVDSIISLAPSEKEDKEAALDEMLEYNRNATLALLQDHHNWWVKCKSGPIRSVSTELTDPATIAAAARFALTFGLETLEITTGDKVSPINIS